MRTLLLTGICLFFTLKIKAQIPADSLKAQVSAISQIIITGNHKTRESIIHRELTFHVGDTLPAFVLESAIERSRQNLMNTSLFNFAEIRYFQGKSNETVVHINLTERWYLWPAPVFEIADRNLNEWWQNKDLRRTNYGLYIRQENFSGRDDILQVQALFGYTHRLGLYYLRPYINKKMNLGISCGFYTTRQKELSWSTTDNKLNFYKNPDSFVRNETQAFLRFTKRQGVYHYYNTTIDYRYTHVSDTVLVLNDRYFAENYPVQQHLGIGWSYRYDRRDYQPYALKGSLFEFEVNQTGLGFLPHEPRLSFITAGFRHYFRISEKWHTGVALKGRLTQRRPAPYFNQRALGYGGDYIRGYDLYVMNGQQFALFRSNLKYTLLKQRVYEFPYIRSEKFKKFPVALYLNGFFDTGYVKDQVFGSTNPLSNSIQYGYGLSLDLVTYYDIVIRMEYAANRIGDQGFYLRIGSIF